MRNIWSKIKSLSIGKHFHHHKCMGANFQHSRASNTEVNSLIWPKFELIREFMAVLATCKFDEDPIKIEGTIDRTRSNMGFFGSQGQVTPKWIVWSGQNLNSSENFWLSYLPASLMEIRSKFQCRCVLLLWHMVGQGPAVLAAGAGWVGYVLFIFKSRLSYLPFLMPHLLGDSWTFWNIVVPAILTQR